MPGKVLLKACADCQGVEATLDIRRRWLCRECFIRYVNSKVLKRMESYRFKNSQDDTRRKLLLPVSAGVSSLVLLQVLDSQLQKQLSNRNRTAYDLCILMVDEDMKPDEHDHLESSKWYELLQKKFPSHSYVPTVRLSAVLSLDPTLEKDLEEYGLERTGTESDSDFCARIISSLSSVTASSDVQTILLTRLIWSYGKQQSCESILWGHSDSCLAAKVLAGVAKGRGGSLPYEICDGPSLAGINFNYPLRDLFKSELSLYASLLPEPFAHLLIKKENAIVERVSVRNTSIDDLLTSYITSQGEKYPGIMANVVRTINKLQPPKTTDLSKRCRICLMPVGNELSQDLYLCYGCSRTRHDIRRNTGK